MLAILGLVGLTLLQGALAFIPAYATNSSSAAVAGGVNVTDVSKLNLQWFSHGSYAQFISLGLSRNESTGISKGVLVHLSEANVSARTAPTSAPWIAFVLCDANSTQASTDTDIFTLARSKGAVAAILYSLTSTTCVLNPTHLVSDNPTLDVYYSPSLSSSQLLEFQFGQLEAPTVLFDYDSQQLNESSTDIMNSIAQGYPISGGYFLATLAAFNATGDPVTDGTLAGNNNTASLGTHNSSGVRTGSCILVYLISCFSAVTTLLLIYFPGDTI